MKIRCLALFLLSAVVCGGFELPKLANPSHAELMLMGRQVFQHECGGQMRSLTAWNKGEGFASMGIGHFIWYPQGKKKIFQESFPQLVKFLTERGSPPPEWLRRQPNHCPWKTHQAFSRARGSRQLRQVRSRL